MIKSTPEALFLPTPSPLGTFSAGGQTFEAQLSSEPADPRWDEFLQRSAVGQFQQSGAWAGYKVTQGWSVIRVVLSCQDSIVGGFQILWKDTRFGRVAYLSKGPVIPDDTDALSVPALELLRSLAADHRFRAMIVQPPDDSGLSQLDAFQTSGFLPAPFLGVIDSTLLIDLAGGEPEVFRSSAPRRETNTTGRSVMG